MRQKYSTDVTDEQWAIIAPLFKGMRNRKWRNLPHDFPPYSTVHSFYRRARLSGLWDKILKRLVEVTRKQEGIQIPLMPSLIHSRSRLQK